MGPIKETNTFEEAIPSDIAIKTPDEMNTQLREIASQNQLYSIALFDILGFSNYVEENGFETILTLYNIIGEQIHGYSPPFKKKADIPSEI